MSDEIFWGKYLLEVGNVRLFRSCRSNTFIGVVVRHRGDLAVLGIHKTLLNKGCALMNLDEFYCSFPVELPKGLHIHLLDVVGEFHKALQGNNLTDLDIEKLEDTVVKKLGVGIDMLSNVSGLSSVLHDVLNILGDYLGQDHLKGYTKEYILRDISTKVDSDGDVDSEVLYGNLYSIVDASIKSKLKRSLKVSKYVKIPKGRVVSGVYVNRLLKGDLKGKDLVFYKSFNYEKGNIYDLELVDKNENRSVELFRCSSDKLGGISNLEFYKKLRSLCK